MSKTTIYKCDKCGVEQDNSTQFWKLRVGVDPYGYLVQKVIVVPPEREMDVCRPCLELLGIYISEAKIGEESAPSIPTLEELIIEIVRNAMEEESD